MLKSTYQKPEAASEKPASVDIEGLPAGWTAHKAPSGHTYYYNAETKKSTYVKPEAEAPRVSIPSFAAGEYAGGFQGSNFSVPQAYPHTNDRRGANGHRREPNDRPKHRYIISACKPWVLVKTRLGRRFVHNTETGESLWRFPEDVLLAVTEFDAKERDRQERRERGEASESESEAQKLQSDDEEGADANSQSSSEYTEVEVTDSEEDGAEEDADLDDEGPLKRRRIAEQAQEGPIEFNEDDLVAEMENMEEYGYEDEWQSEEEDPLSEEDARMLFFELLEDFNVKPFSTWDKVVEEGHIIDDSRYGALPNMRARRAAWDDWSRQKIQEVKERRAKQEKLDPRIPYLAFLQDHASTKLYWPEFKRKYRKEPVMKDMKLADKEKEKLYREHIKRLLLSQSALKADFTTVLKSLPLAAINKNTSLAELPSALLTKLEYISLPPSTRDALLETYLGTLGPAPVVNSMVENESDILAKQKERKRREDALKDRERQVAEAKRRQRRDLEFGKGRLRGEEMELERAMHIGRDGLKAQLANVSIKDPKISDG